MADNAPRRAWSGWHRPPSRGSRAAGGGPRPPLRQPRDLPGAPVRGARGPEPRRPARVVVRGRAHRRPGDRAAARPDGLPAAARWHGARGRRLRRVPRRLPAHAEGAHALALLAGRRERRPVGARLRACSLQRRVSPHDPELSARCPRQAAARSSARTSSGRSARARCACCARRAACAGFAILALVLGVASLLRLGFALRADRRQGLLRPASRSPPRRSCCSCCRPLARTARLGPHRTSRRSGSRRAACWDAFTGACGSGRWCSAAMGLVLAAAASSLREPRRGRAGRPPRVATGCSGPRGAAPVRAVRAVALAGRGPRSRSSGPWRRCAASRWCSGAALAFEGLRSCSPSSRRRGRGGGAPGRGGARPTHERRAPGWPRAAPRRSSVCWCVAPDRRWHRLAAQPRRAPAGRGVQRPLQRRAALCDRPLDQVVFPGAHNAMSAADYPGWMFPNQELGMAAQLRPRHPRAAVRRAQRRSPSPAA